MKTKTILILTDVPTLDGAVHKAIQQIENDYTIDRWRSLDFKRMEAQHTPWDSEPVSFEYEFELTYEDYD